MQTAISVVAIGCAVASFLVYLALTLNWTRPAAGKEVEHVLREAVVPAKSLTGVSAKDAAELLKALAALADSLVKAGPALWSLIGSALFLLIASLAAGVFTDSPAPERSSPQTNATSTASGDNENLKVEPR